MLSVLVLLLRLLVWLAPASARRRARRGRGRKARPAAAATGTMRSRKPLLVDARARGGGRRGCCRGARRGRRWSTCSPPALLGVVAGAAVTPEIALPCGRACSEGRRRAPRCRGVESRGRCRRSRSSSARLGQPLMAPSASMPMRRASPRRSRSSGRGACDRAAPSRTGRSSRCCSPATMFTRSAFARSRERGEHREELEQIVGLQEDVGLVGGAPHRDGELDLPALRAGSADRARGPGGDQASRGG